MNNVGGSNDETSERVVLAGNVFIKDFKGYIFQRLVGGPSDINGFIPDWIQSFETRASLAQQQNTLAAWLRGDLPMRNRNIPITETGDDTDDELA